jgi:hypothetical protein
MIGRPHLLHGTVASGARSPGMNTFVSHELHVTIFKAFSLMLEINLAPRANPTTVFIYPQIAPIFADEIKSV